MALSRRLLLMGAGAAAARVACAQAPRSADIALTCGHVLPATHPTHLRMAEMARVIGEQTHGRVHLQVHPAGELGSDTEQLQKVRSGALDFLSLSPLVVGSWLPAVQISGVAFAFGDVFGDYRTIWSALDGKLGEWVRAQIGRTELFAFEKIWDNGYRQMTSRHRSITHPEDLKGFRMRVAVSPIFSSVFKRLNATPVPVNFTGVYSALQKGEVDGMENSLSLLHTARIYEVQKFCALTSHMWDGFWMVGNQKTFARLPVDVQKVIRAAVNDAGLVQRAEIRKLNETVARQLVERGMLFTLANQDEFRTSLRKAGYYAEWRAAFGEEAWALLERYTGKLA